MRKLRAWFSDPNRPLSNWAQVASAIVAAIALLAIYYQVSTLRANAQHAAARQVYMSYSDSVLRFPEFAEPHLDEIKKDHLKFVQYRSYVSLMLFAYDEILALGVTPEWLASIKLDLLEHKDYLCEENQKEFYEVYHRRMRDLLAEFKAQNCNAPPKPPSNS
jgi:hypothetical protein